ncbi:MAG: DEAD/DEAH box helicase [Elusimicrobia bacterium]|nr:DEAD/DEAH box helicase [Elusimicrobiota bacterium]
MSEIRVFVIDEADEMLRMGFIEDVDFITKCMVQKHQTLLFSATMPAEIKKLAEKYLKDPVHILLNTDKVQPDNLTHKKISVSQADKEKALLEILRSEEISQAIIFCNTRSRVEKLYKKIKKAVKGVDYIHGGLSQGRRTSTMNRFRRKSIKYMVTTDVMARGMDISGVSHIINFDVTQNPETYIHRSGRTARMGKEGVSISLVSSREQDMYSEIEKKSDFKPGKFQKSIFRRGKKSSSRRRKK